MATQFDKFIATMKKVLMLDQADLDFGIYRIMNRKRDQIESYLNNDLRRQVAEAISENASNDAEALQKGAGEVGFYADGGGHESRQCPPKSRSSRNVLPVAVIVKSLKMRCIHTFLYSLAAIMMVETLSLSAVTRRTYMPYLTRARR